MYHQEESLLRRMQNTLKLIASKQTDTKKPEHRSGFFYGSNRDFILQLS